MSTIKCEPGIGKKEKILNYRVLIEKVKEKQQNTLSINEPSRRQYLKASHLLLQ